MGAIHLNGRTALRWFWIILGLHLILSGIYGLAIPMGEAYDEQGHYAYVRYLVDHRRIPTTTRQESELTPGEDLQFSQPPLYYGFAALATAWVSAEPELPLEENPHLFSHGLNRFLHPPDEAEQFPQELLALRVSRLVSMLLSTVAVLATFQVTRTAFDNRWRLVLAATAVTAFNPMFLFMSSVVNNDVAVVVAGGLFFLFTARFVLNPTVRGGVGMGTSLGLALLSKYNALALVPAAGLAGLWVSVRGFHSPYRRRLAVALLAALGAASLGVIWWLVPQSPLQGGPWRRFPDRLTRATSDVVDPVQLATDLVTYLRSPRIGDTFRSFWGVFGWANIPMDETVYFALAVAMLLSAFGLWRAWRGFRDQQRRAIAIAIFTLAAVLFAGIYRELDSQIPVVGRYILIGLSPFSLLVATGLAAVHSKLRLDIAGSIGLFLLAVAVPFRYVTPAYARPPIYSADDSVQAKTSIHARFGQEIELLGYDLDTSSSTPGGRVDVTLYLRAVRPIERNYTMGLHLLGPEFDAVSRIDTLSGRGNWPTSFWGEDEVVRDRYGLTIPHDFPSPTQAWLKLTFFTYPGEYHLSVSDGMDRPLGDQLLLGPIPVRGGSQAQLSLDTPVNARVGAFAELSGYSLVETGSGAVLKVRIGWAALKSPGHDYTVFVHLLDDEGRLLAQHDGPPRGGTYPTRFWVVGDLISDEHVLAIPKVIEGGRPTLVAGMYDPATLVRVPAFGADGHRLLDDLIPLGEVALNR